MVVTRIPDTAPAGGLASACPGGGVDAAGGLSLRQVGVTYGTGDSEVHALTDVTCDIPTGEFVAVVGPSGCGKSTLLMAVAGLTQVTAGSILLDGSPIDGPTSAMGVAFQTDALVDWRTVLGNVLLQFELRGQRSKPHRQRALELLDSVGLGGFADKRPYELSGGMRQRVAICRALIHEPSLLLMDEPFGALDAFTRDQMMSDLQDLWLKTGKTVLFVTHSIPEAVFLADRILVMTPRPGRLQEVVSVKLARPRQLADQSHPDFASAVANIRGIFNEQGIPA